MWVAACLYRGVCVRPLLGAYLRDLMMPGYLPRPAGAAFGPLNRFLTTGFLPPPFREQLELRWTGRDQRRFESVMAAVAAVNRPLPGPVRRFPFNACLYDLRARIRLGRALASADGPAA